MNLRAIGHVESPLIEVDDAPCQADEGAPGAVLALDADVAAGLTGMEIGDLIVIITWLDRADRNTLAVHPRSDPDRPLTGVFATRSPHRPNPIGLHEAAVTSIDGHRITVDHLEAVDGTPIVDIKARLGDETTR